MTFSDEDLVTAARSIAAGQAATDGERYPTRPEAKAAGDALRDELRAMGIPGMRVDTRAGLGETSADGDFYHFYVRK